MYRFFVPPSSIKGRRATMEGEVAHRVGRVLRMSPGDEIVLLDNSGDEYTVRLTGFTKDVVEGDVVSVDRASIETAIEITLYQGMVKGDKFQWVQQKGTELGVSNFVPLMCHRSIPKERASWRESRYPGWSKTVTEAAEQSRRCLLPELRPPMDFKDACEEAQGSGLSIMPWEREGARGLRSALQGTRPNHVNIFIGPEGGFEEWEATYALSRGVVLVSLGKRILRSETAGIATVAAVQYEVGELGG